MSSSTSATNVYVGPDSDRERLRTQAEGIAARWVALARRHGLKDGQRVLDVGCGLGTIAASIARQLPAARIAGVDVDPHALAEAREHHGHLVAFQQGRAEDLPVPSEAYDFVLVSLVLMHVADPLAVLKEARRVLAPGGTVCVMDTDDAFFLMDPPTPAFERLKELLAAWYEQRGGSRRRGRALVRLLAEAGLAPRAFEVEVVDALTLGERAFAETYMAIFRVQAGRIAAAGIAGEQELKDLLAELDAAVARGYFASIAGLCASGTRPT